MWSDTQRMHEEFRSFGLTRCRQSPRKFRLHLLPVGVALTAAILAKFTVQSCRQGFDRTLVRCALESLRSGQSKFEGVGLEAFEQFGNGTLIAELAECFDDIRLIQ